MKKIFLLLIFLSHISFNASYSQVGNSPYPVIFVHGLNSDDQTWSAILTKLSTVWNLSTSHNLNFVLNARGGDTTNYLFDVLIPERDASGNFVNRITSSSIYTNNFKNFWNRNASDPRIILNSNTLPGSNQNPSNQSAIYKQGYALKILIDSVLRVTGASKVILLGHSMGGLAIREYLQRKESGIHKWWIDPNDSVSGHKVAAVITIGTPHLGTDVSSIPFTGIDFKSEAIRDMRNTFTSGNDGAYLFGNSETNVPGGYYNKDINCNGAVTDNVTGLDSNTTFNSLAPLPLNIRYKWIMSNYLNLGTDLAVPVSSQALYQNSIFVPYGLTDTLMTNKNHIQETGDTKSLIRGLDEPDTRDFAYDISFNKLYSGFITSQSRGITSDTDFYKVDALNAGELKIKINSANSGVTNISILSDNGSILQAKNITASPDSISNSGTQGAYYIRVTGNSALNPNLVNYSFTANLIPALELNITLGIEGMWDGIVQIRDTVKVYLRNSITPFNNTDSAIAYLDSTGNSNVTFLKAAAGNYYIQLAHRNALETWSANPVSFTNGITANYDFTSSQSMAFGNNLVLKSGRWCLFSGDIDRNGQTDLSDITGVYNDASNFITGYVKTDLTGDNEVTLTDLIIAYNNSAGFISLIKP